MKALYTSHYRLLLTTGAVLGTLLAASAVLALDVGVAAAHTTSFESTVTIGVNQERKQYFGTVSSPRAGCVPDRLVKLFRDEGQPDTLVGSDRTNETGRWRVATNVEPGVAYYARVTRRDIGRPGHNHICNSARSLGVIVKPL
jgi:hypothetical protein